MKVFFPSASSDRLLGEEREIFETASPVDRAKQILSDLISGPSSDATLAALPEGTRLRQVYLMDSGTAYVDLSSELRTGATWGTDEEILAVYAVVDSIILNVPEIRRVGILVDGRPCETLGGHVDLRRPFVADRGLIEGGAPPVPEEAAEGESKPAVTAGENPEPPSKPAED